MALDHQQLFAKLLQQLQLSDEADQPYFAGAQLEKLTIHEKSKRWHFDFKLPQILPFETFLTFQSQLNTAFKQIARVDFSIQTDQQDLNDRLLGDYWEWVVQHSDLHSPLVQELCHKQVPTMDDGRAIFMSENEVVKNFLVNQALGPIETQYQQYGFPQFSIHTMVDETASQQKIQEFKQQRAQSDAELAQKAVAAIKKANEKREKNASENIAEGPTVIGRKIKPDEDPTKLIDIQEEEKSVIVQGYVFNKEVRDLRSGRKLMILEITDYTSSIAIKKFSRDESDEAQFNGLNEGDWIKVRGGVQEDNFMRDLVMNAYDINQVKVPSRQDTAPEGEKRVELHLHTAMSTMDATNSITDYVNQAKNGVKKQSPLLTTLASRAFQKPIMLVNQPASK